MTTKPAHKVVVAPLMRISASPAQQHLILIRLLSEMTLIPGTVFRVKRPGKKDWYYRVLGLLPDESSVIITSDTKIEIGPRYQDLKSVFTLRVANVCPPDRGRLYVRMDTSLMRKFGLDRGDYLALWVPRVGWKIGVQVFPAFRTDACLPILRMDEMIRENIPLKVGQTVKCQVIVKQVAERVTFRPVSQVYTLTVSPSILRKRLIHAPVTRGQVFQITGKVRKIPPPTHPHIRPFFKMETFGIMVDVTEPAGIVVIEESTEIVVEARVQMGTLPLDE